MKQMFYLQMKKFCSQSKLTQSHLLRSVFTKGVQQKKIPFFEVYSSQIEILSQPIDYYLAIIKLIRSAKHRIVLSSLYLGTGKMEEFIVDEILRAIQKNNRLQVTILLDKSRGTREDKQGNTSLQMLKKLKTETFPHARYVNISFFSHPFKKNYHEVLPGVLSEIIGVQHTKVHVFDDHSILTGANLSNDYFSNRQDRYYIVQACEPLANYLEDFVKIISNISFQMNQDGELKLSNHFPDPYKQKAEFCNTIIQQLKMLRYDNRVKIPLGEELKMEEYFSNIKGFNNYPPDKGEKSEELKLIEFGYRSRQEIQTVLPESLQYLKGTALLNDTRNHKDERNSDQSNIKITQEEGSKKVFIMPLVQFSPIKEEDDIEMLQHVLKETSFNKLSVSSAYINFPAFLVESLKKLKNCDLELITSAPQANSFYKAGRFKKHIPCLYRLYELNILKALKGNQNSRLFEFHRDGWTYHSKGMWFYEFDKRKPNATFIGSSNYNIRSYTRDLELQFFLYSTDDNFNQKMEGEVNEMVMDSYEVDEKMIKKDKDTKIKLSTRVFGKILKNYL